MRRVGIFLLSAGFAGAAAAAGLATDDARLAVQATSELSTGSLDEPAGVPVRQSTLGVRYRAEGWTAQVDLPWRQVAGQREAVTLPAAGSRIADQGVGNARLKLVVPLRRADAGSTSVDLVLRARSGTGTAVAGFDPGPAGQSVRLALRRPVGEWNVFGDVGWRRAGDLPGTDRGRAAWQGELGVWRYVAPRLEAGAYADLRQRVGGEPAMPEATVYAALDQGTRRWQVFVSRAFAPYFPDVAIGVSYRASF